MIHFNDHALLINESHRLWTGEYLISENDPGQVLAALNQADMVIITQGLESEPIFNYGNIEALKLFGYELEAFVQIPCDQTIPISEAALEQEMRAELSDRGSLENCSAHRVALNGSTFQLSAGFVWQLKDNLGRIHGQASAYRAWQAT